MSSNDFGHHDPSLIAGHYVRLTVRSKHIFCVRDLEKEWLRHDFLETVFPLVEGSLRARHDLGVTLLFTCVVDQYQP